MIQAIMSRQQLEERTNSVRLIPLSSGVALASSESTLAAVPLVSSFLNSNVIFSTSFSGISSVYLMPIAGLECGFALTTILARDNSREEMDGR